MKKPSHIKVTVADEDGTLLDFLVFDLDEIWSGLQKDPREIITVADEAKDMVADEITAALKRRRASGD